MNSLNVFFFSGSLSCSVEANFFTSDFDMEAAALGNLRRGVFHFPLLSRPNHPEESLLRFGDCWHGSVCSNSTTWTFSRCSIYILCNSCIIRIRCRFLLQHFWYQVSCFLSLFSAVALYSEKFSYHLAQTLYSSLLLFF